MTTDQERTLFHNAKPLVCGHFPNPNIRISGSMGALNSRWDELDVCNDCATALTRMWMEDLENKSMGAYLSDDLMYVTSSGGGQIAKVISKTTHKRPRSWVSSTYTYFHCIDTYGREWYGGGYGEGMCCWMKRCKDSFRNKVFNPDTGNLEPRTGNRKYEKKQLVDGVTYIINENPFRYGSGNDVVAMEINSALYEGKEHVRRNWYEDDELEAKMGETWGQGWEFSYGSDDLLYVSNDKVVREEMARFIKSGDAEEKDSSLLVRMVWIDQWGNRIPTKAGLEIANLRHRYDNYCILDEEDLSQMEMEAHWELMLDACKSLSLVNYPVKVESFIQDGQLFQKQIEDSEKLANEVYNWMHEQNNTPPYRNFRSMETSSSNMYIEDSELDEAIHALGYVDHDDVVMYAIEPEYGQDDVVYRCTECADEDEDLSIEAFDTDNQPIRLGTEFEGSCKFWIPPFIRCSCGRVYDKDKYTWKFEDDARQPWLIEIRDREMPPCI